MLSQWIRYSYEFQKLWGQSPWPRFGIVNHLVQPSSYWSASFVSHLWPIYLEYVRFWWVKCYVPFWFTRYWQTSAEKEGKNPMQTLLPYIALLTLLSPFAILAVAFANNWIKLPNQWELDYLIDGRKKFSLVLVESWDESATTPELHFSSLCLSYLNGVKLLSACHFCTYFPYKIVVFQFAAKYTASTLPTHFSEGMWVLFGLFLVFSN